MARTESQRERALYRKTQRMLETAHGGYAGASIVERLEAELDIAMARHLDAAKDSPERATTRSEVRGIARGVGLMRSPYYPIRGLKQAEKDSAERVRSARAREQQDEA